MCITYIGQRCTEGGVGRGSLVGRTPEEVCIDRVYMSDYICHSFKTCASISPICVLRHVA